MKIPRYKPKFTQHMIILFAVIIAMLNLSANNLTAHAEEGNIAKWAQVLADSKGTSGSGGTTQTTNGVSYTRTGYLCYLLTADGQKVPGTDAKAFKSPGYNGIANSKWYCNSRKGDYSATSWDTTPAPWGCTPWKQGGATNEPDIRGWMTKEVGGVSRAATFVQDCWGDKVADLADQFDKGELILVVETIMNFQWSTTGSSSSSSARPLTPYERAEDLVEKYIVNHGERGFMAIAKSYGFGTTCAQYEDAKNFGQDNRAYQLYLSIKNRLIDAIEKVFKENNTTTEESTGGECILHGQPVIGTLPCLLDYKSTLHLPTSKTRLDSYTNKVACFAEMIEAGKAGEKAGFKPWTGSTNAQISDANVKTYGLAMGVYTAHGDTTPTTGTHTWDSDKNPSGSGAEDKAPEPPTSSTPLERKFTIIKSYRVKDKTTGVIEDRGTFKRTQTVATIRIEDEPLNTTDKNYKVIGWKHSSTERDTITAIGWEGKVPALI